MFHDTANGKSTRISNFTAALEHKHVDSSVNNVTVGGIHACGISNALFLVILFELISSLTPGTLEQHVNSTTINVRVGVPLFGNAVVKWLYRKPNLQRIVLGKGNASQVIMRYKNGKYNCYQDGFFGKMECQEHFSVTFSASSDITVRMRNISDPHFGRYLISVYRGPDDKIDTLWITVYKKGVTSQGNGTTNESEAPRPTTPGVTSQVNETTNEPKALGTTTPGTGNKTGAVIGGILGALFFLMLLIVGIRYYIRHERQRHDKETANQSQDHLIYHNQSG